MVVKNDPSQNLFFKGFSSVSQRGTTSSEAQTRSIFSSMPSSQSNNSVPSNIFGSSNHPTDEGPQQQQSSIFAQGNVQSNPFRSKILVNPHFGKLLLNTAYKGKSPLFMIFGRFKRRKFSTSESRWSL